jgi:BirA family transcriptional regulator, biotin operon repressor / biotin---[acetyl-CoA-carboxylase] ligase
VPLRQPPLPAHHAGAQALGRPGRMSTSPQDGRHLEWGAEALWQRLEPLLPGLSVEIAARVDSTNTRLLERARHTDDAMPCLLVAEHQTDGRGRLGRHWHASAGNSLTFSLALALAPREWSGLSLAVGLALADALQPDARATEAAAAAPEIGLKWPNDLWLLQSPRAGRKLGGILIETLSVGDRRVCVVGVGLNVAPQPADGPSAGSACLQELVPGITAPQALAAVAEPLVRGLLAFQDRGFAPLQARFARRDLLAGQTVSTTAAGVAEGVAEGVDEHGGLRVRAGGMVHTLLSGEVSVRLQPVSGAAC